ncbi:potassium channel family protein [Flavobacterium litorale]|uniref:TrkA family potassium uptake protein n=1 Tax=Flavobacterium litorale TaxID=2856519 RepID=A0ABX8V8H4_9FLAO|nr:TrkA family potassium uptake protein [Flavobacterium litorale]QYJ69135.1 TrkA family potassium uptake protein [Flavobacterium litorale]
MKIIIFGLGNFGMSLAVNLTETGNEVIGIDNDMGKVNLVKNQISHAVCMDATNELAYQALPVKDADLAVIAIGENEGAAIIATAIIKKLSGARIIGRSLSPIHDTVLEAMGIETIIHPEQDFADRLAKKINLKGIVDNFNIDKNYSISEIKALPEFTGKTLEELEFRQTYNMHVVTIIRKQVRKSIIGTTSKIDQSEGFITKDCVIMENDLLVVFGLNKDIGKFCNRSQKSNR